MNHICKSLVVVVAILAVATGCSTPIRNCRVSGSKLPVNLVVKFDASEKADAALNEKIRPAVLKALALGFVSVTEIQAQPPYREESLKENSIDGVIGLRLIKVGSHIPILLQIEGYSVTYDCEMSIYDEKGNLVQKTPTRGQAGFRSPVISGFNNKAKLSKLGDKAANNLSADILEKAYNAYK